MTRYGFNDDVQSVQRGPSWCLRLFLTAVVFTAVLVAAGHAAACLCFVHEGRLFGVGSKLGDDAR